MESKIIPVNSLINIVLYQPEIPQNTGNIARLCVSNDLHLHLIKPLGFELTDKYLKRSGLDYWEYINYTVYNSWEEFLDLTNASRLWFLTTKSSQAYWDIKFEQGDYFVFGPETRGLPEELMIPEQSITVPMSSVNARSLNLASTVQTVAYEALRQLTLA